MPNDFPYDVFLSHSAKDKQAVPVPTVVRPRAKRLRAGGLKVWLDEWELPSPAGAREGGRRPGEGRGVQADSIPAEIEDGLEHSRVLPLAHRMGEGGRRPGKGCLSAQAFGSDWVQLLKRPQPSTLDPQPACDLLNRERRLISLRLDDATACKARQNYLPLQPQTVIP
jgi:hypothetical protein